MRCCKAESFRHKNCPSSIILTEFSSDNLDGQGVTNEGAQQLHGGGIYAALISVGTHMSLYFPPRSLRSLSHDNRATEEVNGASLSSEFEEATLTTAIMPGD